jgi:hypothetical protein
MIEICRKSPDEARQGPVPDEYEHGRARREEGPRSAISSRDDQGKRVHHRRRTAAEDDQTKKSEGWPMAKERGGGGGGKPQRRPKATFDILMAKYMEGRADIMGCENWTLRNPKLDSPVSLSQASSSTIGSSSSKWSRTLMCQKSEGRGHC